MITDILRQSFLVCSLDSFFCSYFSITKPCSHHSTRMHFQVPTDLLLIRVILPYPRPCIPILKITLSQLSWLLLGFLCQNTHLMLYKSFRTDQSNSVIIGILCLKLLGALFSFDFWSHSINQDFYRATLVLLRSLHRHRSFVIPQA